MAKRVFLLFLICLFEVAIAPNFLTAGGPVAVKSPEFNDVLTVEPEPEVVEEPVVATVNAPAIVTAAPVAPVYVPPANNIAIAGQVIQINDVPDTSYDAGNFVNKYGANFLYGHNSWNVFGNLINVPVGGTFTVTYGGVVTNYRVDRIVIFEKNVATGQLQLNGAGNYMRRVANANFEGVQYNLSLMTCYGTAYGNGDASHRLVLFANAI